MSLLWFFCLLFLVAEQKVGIGTAMDVVSATTGKNKWGTDYQFGASLHLGVGKGLIFYYFIGALSFFAPAWLIFYNLVQFILKSGNLTHFREIWSCCFVPWNKTVEKSNLKKGGYNENFNSSVVQEEQSPQLTVCACIQITSPRQGR